MSQICPEKFKGEPMVLCLTLWTDLWGRFGFKAESPLLTCYLCIWMHLKSSDYLVHITRKIPMEGKGKKSKGFNEGRCLREIIIVNETA